MENLLCDEVWIMSPNSDHKHADDHDEQGNVGNYSGSNNTTAQEDCDRAFGICLQKEHGYMPEPQFLDYLKSYNLILPRFTALQWFIKSQTRLNLSFATVFNAANYLDRFISMKQCQEWKYWMFELLSVACLSIASKFGETNPPPLHEIQMEDLGHSFESCLIQRMELAVLKALGWRLNSTTAYSYVELLTLNLYDSLKSCLLEELTTQLTEFLLTTLLDLKYLEFRPCVIAISALQCICEELLPSTSGTHLAYIFKLIPQDQQDDLIKCREIMEGRLVHDPNLYNLITCERSYHYPSSPVTVLTMEQVDMHI